MFIPSKHCMNTKYWDQGRLPPFLSKDAGQACEWKSILPKMLRTGKGLSFIPSVGTESRQNEQQQKNTFLKSSKGIV